MITQRVQVYDKYDYTTSTKGHNDVCDKDDGKGLAEGVGR